MLLKDTSHVRWAPARVAARITSQHAGDLIWLANHFPNLSVRKLTGRDWTVVFAGSDASLPELRHLLFADQQPVQEELKPVTLWDLAHHTRRWLSGEAHLVVCELSRIHPWRLRDSLTFTVPTWVCQTLSISEPPDRVLSGRQLHATRHRINRARRNGFGYTFSHSPSDFDYFYHRMYEPYVTDRHKERALITPYPMLKRRAFDKGGLLFVTYQGKPVAGNLCYVAGDTCYSIEGGVLDSDPQLHQLGISALIDWYTLLWGYEQGAREFNMGGSHAWCSNGSFQNKQRWRAQVTRRTGVYGTWHFLAKRIPPSLQAHLNRVQFIGEHRGQHYRVLIDHESPGAEAHGLNWLLSEAKEQGLAGIQVVSPYHSSYLAQPD